MKLDRDLQLQILNRLAEAHPFGGDIDDLINSNDEETIASNLKYLSDHRLINHDAISISVDNCISFGHTEITHHGLDFLSDDGGLSAILGVVTIKFHEDTLKALLESHVAKSDLDQPSKNRLIAGIRSLSADSIKHLTMKLLDSGLDSLPHAAHVIQTYLGGLF